jgi:CheY-like chemotaxis protein
MKQDDYVLYAEDDPDDIHFLKHAVGSIDPGVNIFTVGSGEELIDQLENLNEDTKLPCLIIIDLSLPKMDGESTMTYLKKHERFSNIQLILFSVTQEFRNNSLLQKWNVPYMMKPSNLSAWQDAAKKILNYCSP